jgi:hypothetical protein
VILSNTIAVLERTPAALDALLRGLPETWTTQNEGENSWNVRQVIAHLIHGERTDWMPRVRWILEFGDRKPFPPFDREAHLRDARSLNELLTEFADARTQSLKELRALNLELQQELAGLHPALGPVTLSQLLATWVVHDLTHLHQISRVMAHQYREAVGPWQEYLGVLKCSGS